MRVDDEDQSDEEDVFEFDLLGNRGLGKEKGPRKENGMKGNRKSNLEEEQSESDEVSGLLSESSDLDEEVDKIICRKRVCRSRGNRTNEDLRDMLNGGSSSEEEFE